MFKDINEMEDFQIFCHTHFDVFDVWHNSKSDKGILFEGWHDNKSKSQIFNPNKLKEHIPYKKRRTTKEMYEIWQKIKNF